MVPVLLLLIPLISGLALFAVKNENSVKTFALLSSIVTLVVALYGMTCANGSENLLVNKEWLPALNSRFHMEVDGMGKVLTLLTALSFPIIFAATSGNRYEDSNRFYALMLLTQAGLMGVFMAMDALLFYFFWELALIPVYFLCSHWGGEKRIQVTFKFFVYTFVGSLLMLTALIYLYFHAGQSFDIKAFYSIKLTSGKDALMFWLMFVAFAIKMPLVPFHTWQPDTYEQSPTAVTMILSGVMVKMGVFGVIRWVAPVLPISFYQYGDTITWMAIIGMIYASLVAMQQDDLKRLVAYSSIAHIGLMVVALFATTKSGMQGVMIQMFNHGINIIGMWVVVNAIEQKFGTRKMSQLGGIAQKAPSLAILLVIVALANIALPLTNAFIGEFMMFNGVFASTVTSFNVVFTVCAAITIILGAVYTLKMLQKVLFGEASAVTAQATDISFSVKASLVIIVGAIVLFGVYPKPMLGVTNELVDVLLSKMTLTMGK
jgi:NADH-quinone oxidoreductase subunit M